MGAHSTKRVGTLRTALLGSIALGLAIPTYAAGAEPPSDQADKINRIEKQMELLMQQLQELQELQAKQGEQQDTIQTQQQRIEVQQQQIDDQQKQMDAQQQQPAPAPANVVTGGDQPGSFKLPGTNTSVKISGYVKGDAFYDVNADLGDSFAFSSIPAEGSTADNREGHFRAHARQSRINLQTWTPTDFGEIHTYVEGDFFGTGGNEVFSNSTSFRLRHAFGELGPLLVGQTWSNFMYLDAYPDTVDFFGPVGIPFVRQGQVRYTHAASDNLELAVSLENSEFSGLGPANETIGSTRSTADDLQFGIDTLPDFTGRATYSNDLFSASLSGVARQLEVDDGGDLSAGPADDAVFGWGLLGAGVLNLGELSNLFGQDTVQANFTYGDGIGRYLINGFNADARLDADGSLDTIEAWGAATSYTHYWTDELRSNFVYGHYDVEAFSPDTTETLDSFHVNLMWMPVEQFQLGLEWIYGMRGFADSNLDNEAQRIHFAAQFFF